MYASRRDMAMAKAATAPPAGRRTPTPSVHIGDIPVGSLIGGGVSLAEFGLGSWIQSARLRGGQKIAATEIVNNLERKLQKNLKEYMALPTPRPQTVQLAVIKFFDDAMDWLSSPDGCGNMQLGSAGQRCIEERYCETAGEGQCRWPWVTWYRTPVAEDKDTYDDQAAAAMAAAGAGAVAGAGAGAGAGGSAGGTPTPTDNMSITTGSNMGAGLLSSPAVLIAGFLLVAAMAFKD